MNPGSSGLRTALVTGCGGFLGRALVRRLEGAGIRVVGLGRETTADDRRRTSGEGGGFEPVRGDLLEYRGLERIVGDSGADVIFHLAAQSQVSVAGESPLETFETNIRGTWNLLEAARVCSRGPRVVIASSEAVYGASTELPYTEESPLMGATPYAVSKIAAEAVGRGYHRTYGVAVAFARMTNVYGGIDRNVRRLVPGTIAAVARGERPAIRGSGLVQRDFLYIEDAVTGLLALAAALDDGVGAGEAFNFGSGVPVSTLAIVESILELMGRPELSPTVGGDVAGEPRAQYSSSEKARSILGWSPETPLESGLRMTIEENLKNLERFRT